MKIESVPGKFHVGDGVRHRHLQKISVSATIALLCHFFAAHCTAGDAVFSNDGQRIYAIGNFENPRTLREISLSDQTVRTIRLSQLPAQDNIRGITRSDGDKFFCVAEEILWTFDPRTGRLTKICDAPKGGRFWRIAYDPKSRTVFMTGTGESGPLFMLKNGREVVPIFMRRHNAISSPVFSADGELFYSETGDLWSGQIESDEDGRFSLNADRYVPLAYLETANTSPNGTGVSGYRGGSRCHLCAVVSHGRFRLGRTIASAATSTQDRISLGYGRDSSKRIREIQGDFAGA
jgi:hypothetical protein